MKAMKLAAAWVVSLSIAGAIIWAIAYAIGEQHRGIYGGEGYSSAREEAVKVMAIRYGGILAAHLRLGVPDEVHTHLRNSATIGRGQVRVFHFIGPKGAKYCVPIWSDGSYNMEANAITKGCKF